MLANPRNSRNSRTFHAREHFMFYSNGPTVMPFLSFNTPLHSFPKEMQPFWSCLSFAEECISHQWIRKTEFLQELGRFHFIRDRVYLHDPAVIHYFCNAPGNNLEKKTHSKIPLGAFTIIKCLRTYHLKIKQLDVGMSPPAFPSTLIVTLTFDLDLLWSLTLTLLTFDPRSNGSWDMNFF